MPITLKSTGGGSVSIDVPSTGATFTLTAPANNATIFTTDGGAITGNVAFTSNNISIGGQTISPAVGMRNRIINGAMVIDQRNSGASITPTTNLTYCLDRWTCVLTQSSKFSVQRNAGSVTPPVGYSNYLGVTSLSAYSVAASDTFAIGYYAEGLSISDFAWGSSSAKTVTLSFWVYSSLTGSFGGTVTNVAAGGVSYRSYPFSYTISSANTWTYITVTIPGDTTGTWLTDNSKTFGIYFGLGSGSTYSGTVNTWASSNFVQPTGTVSVVGTNAATFYITGVQLELGSVATPFERRLYGTELALCQRYYYKIGPAVAGDRVGVGYSASTTISDNLFVFPVTMRIAPTALEQTGTAGDYGVQLPAGNFACSSVPTFNTATNQAAQIRLTVASGLTTGQGNFARLQTTSGYLAWSAEL